MNDIAEQQPKKRTRGKGVKPRLVHVNVRIPAWVLEHYKQKPSYTAAIREVLTMHAQESQAKDNTPT